MSKNGTTSKGTTRYRCTRCGASRSTRHDDTATDLRVGLDWLMGKESQREKTIAERTLRRKAQAMWTRTPPVPMDGIVHKALHLDGIHPGRDAVVLIAMDEDSHAAGWYVARRETAAAWARLLARLTPPDLVVCDGGGGLLKALREHWPDTDVQRCLFHVLLNIRVLTGRNPRYPASRQLLRLAVRLSQCKDADGVRHWLQDYNAWRNHWSAFLRETSQGLDGRERNLHERLAKGRRMLDRLVREGQLFTFLAHPGAPATNNRIESNNAQIRAMLRNHRGLDLAHRIKAVCRWCHEHTEHPMSDAWLARNAVTDEQLRHWYENSWRNSTEYQRDILGMPERYGTGIDWNEFHTAVPWQDNY